MHLSDALRRLELVDLRNRLSLVVGGGACLVVLATLIGAVPPIWVPLQPEDVEVITALAFVVISAINALLGRRPIALILLLSFSGMGSALLFSMLGAPNVALVLVLVETAMTLLLLALIAQVPSRRLREARDAPYSRPRAWFFGIVGGMTAFLVSLSSLSTRGEGEPPNHFLRWAQRAHAKDVVTAILTDFRGLDTAVEVTVFGVAVLGATAVSWRKTT